MHFLSRLICFVFPMKLRWNFILCFFHNYAYICTWMRENLKETVLQIIITWPALWKQNIQAKGAYQLFYQEYHFSFKVSNRFRWTLLNQGIFCAKKKLRHWLYSKHPLVDVFGRQKTCPQLKVAAYGNASCKQRVKLCFVKATVRTASPQTSFGVGLWMRDNVCGEATVRIGFRVSVKGASTVTVIRYLPRYLTEPNPCWVRE